MATENYCVFIGRLTKDPEVKDVGSSTVTKFALAVDDGYKDKNGEWVNKAVFLDCQMWNGQGKALADRCKKGDQIYIRAKYGVDSWEDSEGAKRTSPKFTAFGWQFLSSPGEGKKKAAKPAVESDDDEEQAEQPKAKKGRPKKEEKKATPKPVVDTEDSQDEEDTEDIPF